jgi:hypothetical protein
VEGQGRRCIQQDPCRPGKVTATMGWNDIPTCEQGPSTSTDAAERLRVGYENTATFMRRCKERARRRRASTSPGHADRSVQARRLKAFIKADEERGRKIYQGRAGREGGTEDCAPSGRARRW